MTLDSKKLRELASRPGTFPEMVRATYDAGVEAGKNERLGERQERTGGRRRIERRLGWTIPLIAGGLLTLVLSRAIRG